MFDIVVFVATLIGSVIFAKSLSASARNVMVPLALAYYLLVIVVIGAVGTSGLVHFLFTSMNFVPVMIMCDGLNAKEWHGNAAWKAFVFFYVYMTIIGLTGYLPMSCTMFYLQSFLNTFAAGYFVARWVCRTEGGLRKLVVPLIGVAIVAIIYYVQNQRLLSNELDVYGRMDVSELIDDDHVVNVNGIALRIDAILPFLLLAFFYVRKYLFVKYVALASAIILGLLLVRTGSRNGTLVLLPCIWYFLHASVRGRLKMKYVVALIIVGVIFTVGVLFTNKGVNIIRAFDFSGESQMGIEYSAMDRISTGRWSMYQQGLSYMSPTAKIFGKGGMNSLYSSKGERIVRFRGANAHSIYMTIFYRSGLVGILLFVIFLCVFFAEAKKMGFRGNMAKFFMLCYLLTGIGESWGMNGGATAILAGFAIGLISRRPATNSEFGEIPLGYYGPWNRMA